MTGRERLLRTLAHQETDRPPSDFWSETVTLERLFEYLGHRDLEAFLDEMEVDIRGADAITPAVRAAFFTSPPLCRLRF